MRGRHNITEEEDPEVTDQKTRKMIERCVVTLREGTRTWYDVSLDGEYLGKVRTKAGAMEYCAARCSKVRYAGNTWNPKDPKHCLAILALFEHHNISA